MSEIVIIPANTSVDFQPLDAGFAYGFGLFETIRLADGRLSFWSPHWDRLRASSISLGLKCEFAESAVLEAIRSLVRAENLSDCMIKLSLMRRQSGEVLYIYARPLVGIPDSVELKVEGRFPLNPDSMLSGHKTHNYMEHFAILEQTRAEGFYDAIRLSTAGFLGETTIGNLFFYRDGSLFTPSLDQGILPGVIRGQVLTMTSVVEGAFDPRVLADADAVFMTNSGATVLPVARISVSEVEYVYESHVHSGLVDLRERLLGLEQATGMEML